MKHTEGTFKSIGDAEIYYQAWLPDGEVRAVILLVHGLGEHCGRYGNVVEHFVPQGFAIYGLDHIGHGKSSGEREVVERFEDYLRPLETYYGMVKNWQPDVPIILYGHSMGALIACIYLLDHQADFQGGILSAPVIKVGESISPMTITLSKILSAIAPKMGVAGLDVTALSRDPAVVKAYVEDPLVFHGKTPARLAAELLRAITQANAGLDKLNLPFITLQGGLDRIVDPGGAALLYEKAGSTDKTLKIYDGLYHEVHNEPERQKVFEDMEAWLDKHV
jgi:acylglycerol lipase